jgi:hypothetical protein
MFRAWRAFLYAYSRVDPKLDQELASAQGALRLRGRQARLSRDPHHRGPDLLRKATNVHLPGVREHFLKHVSRTELEHLATALETVLAGEGG